MTIEGSEGKGKKSVMQVKVADENVKEEVERRAKSNTRSPSIEVVIRVESRGGREERRRV